MALWSVENTASISTKTKKPHSFLVLWNVLPNKIEGADKQKVGRVEVADEVEHQYKQDKLQYLEKCKQHGAHLPAS